MNILLYLMAMFLVIINKIRHCLNDTCLIKPMVSIKYFIRTIIIMALKT